MRGLNGGLIGVRRVPSLSGASGVWSPNQQVLQRRVGAWPFADDPDYASVSLLLPMNGTNNSTTFTDYGPNGVTLTRFGDTKISTTESVYGGASGYFDGTGDYLTCSLPAIGTNDFTIECHYRPASLANYRMLYDTRTSAADSGGFVWGVNSSGQLFIYHQSNFRLTTGSLSLNTWYHLRLTRASGTWRIFVDGALQAGTYVSTASLTQTLAYICMDFEKLYGAHGYVDNYRITNGVARSTANFTAPSAPYPTPLA